MFNNTINIKDHIEKFRNTKKEHFGLFGALFGGAISGGNTTDLSSSTKINKNFENNQKINRSMTVNSITKIVNNVANDVVQQNIASAATAVGASNTLVLSNVSCKNVNIAGVRQTAQALNDTRVKATQSNQSKIANEISTNIDKTIEKVGNTDLAALAAENTKKLNDFMNAVPGYDPDAATKLSSQCPNSSDSFISVGNTCKASSSYELNASVKEALDLDESFKIDDTDNVSNDISNKIAQTNSASCTAISTAGNVINLNNIACGDMNISDIDQSAAAKALVTCIFDQKNVSEVANKIMNKIAKKYNQVYDAAQKKAIANGATPTQMANLGNFLDTFAAAGMEKIAAAAGDLPAASAAPAAAPATDTVTNNTSGSNSGNAAGMNNGPSELPPPSSGSDPFFTDPNAAAKIAADKAIVKAAADAAAANARAIANKAAAEATAIKAAAEAAAIKAAADAKAAAVVIAASQAKAVAIAQAEALIIADAAKENLNTILLYAGVPLGVIILIVFVIWLIRKLKEE
jgi:hypothetical protein